MPDQFTELLSGYLDGDLDATTRARVDGHLDACAECREVLAELRQIASAARGYQGTSRSGTGGRPSMRRSKPIE